MNVGKRSGVIIEERMVGLIFMDLKGLEIGFYGWKWKIREKILGKS